MRRIHAVLEILSLVAAGAIAGAGCSAADDLGSRAEPVRDADEHCDEDGADDDAVGLSLWWDNGEVRREDGTPRSVTLYEDFPRFAHELDITSTVVTETDDGIQPVVDSGDMAGLDWRGVHYVEEDWRPAFDGTYTRSRFYRGARWMERPSSFLLVPLDERRRPLGWPIQVYAGSDDRWGPADDGFVRRFVARQITPGCRAIGDCTGATQFIAQGLMQLRNELHPEEQARRLPAGTRYLELRWSADPHNRRVVAVERASYSDTPYRYGFEVRPQIVSAPANGSHFVPGESVDVQVTLTDGEGNRLHPEGTLPSYLDFVNDAIPSGVRYYDGLQQLLTLYYAHKHREALTMWSIAGPTDRLRYPSHVVGTFDFFLPQTDMATVAEDGFTAISTLNPSMASVALPELWGLESPDRVTFVLPAEALAGTYVVTVKARRDWGGEALNRAGVVEVQVGSAVPTEFQPSTGRCNGCHQERSGLASILHGLGDRRACYSCHSTLEFEPDHALDYRIHLIHTRSDRFPADPNDCSVCHLDTPTGPARGFPGIGPH